MIRTFTAIFCFAFSVIHAIAQQTIKPFKTGDRVVFVGNSITDGGHYHSYIWLYYMTRFPNSRIDIYNAGIGGDVSKQIYERLDDDVFSHNPTVVTLTFGMNDTGYKYMTAAVADSTYKAKIAESLKSFRLIEDKYKQHPEVRKIMIASPPYDETSKSKLTPFIGKNNALLQIADVQQQTAKADGWDFVDFNRPLTAINIREEQRDSLFTMENADRVHPTNDAMMVMAYVFLKAQGLAGKKVAESVINASTPRVESVDNCAVTALAATTDRVTFNYLANALPYPMDTIESGFGKPQRAQSAGLKLVPFTEEFNQEILRVKGLKSTGNYQLKIDDKIIGTWGADEYKKGINLAVLNKTPQYQEAMAVMQLNEERWEIERRLREYYWIHFSILKPHGLLFNDGDATVDSLQRFAKKDFFVAVTLPTYQKARFKSVRDAWKKEIALLTDEIYATNKPVNRRVEITLIY
ncbi:SGNH/GDSL hydrolase family protein [Mucilaginibacter sp. BJC16-A38]|uniref:SGNH/GDSL hydrolase family protein n=1 Tax=Mucilaginibacter phenanthrenivorans TaxID=1234842 RepID=UPI002157C165|nr:SGNH/GDSL hydrolase family protein [Mucilaginibacter phenanthrenivorans]MCR8559558.1 SGNH/GDSL hydrolase family protein [Mucilaginibacter phenanthrenivorans]